MSRKNLILLVLLPLVTGCAVSYAEQDVYLRFDPEEDSVDLLLVYKGISASDQRKETFDKAMTILRETQAGRRRLSIQHWGSWDLDDANLPERLDPETRDFVAGIRLLDHGLFLDAAERLSGYQHFKIPSISSLVRSWNKAISRLVLAEMENDDFAKKSAEAGLDARTIELMRARATAGGPWVRLVGTGIELDLPVTPAVWQRWHGEFLLGIRKFPTQARDFLLQHMSYLTHLEVSADRVVLRFDSPFEGLYQLSYKNDEARVRPELRDALKQEGLVDQGLTVDDVRARTGFPKENK